MNCHVYIENFGRTGGVTGDSLQTPRNQPRRPIRTDNRVMDTEKRCCTAARSSYSTRDALQPLPESDQPTFDHLPLLRRPDLPGLPIGQRFGRPLLRQLRPGHLDNERSLREGCILSRQKQTTGGSGLPPFLDGPDHQALTTAHVASRENARQAGRIAALRCLAGGTAVPFQIRP